VQKPYPPFVIGGGGERKTLRITAQYADIWNYGGGPVEEFRHKNQVLDEHCAAIGRDPASITRSVQVRIDPNNLGAARDAFRAFIQAGATHLVPYLTTPPFPEGIARRLADEVIGPLAEA
jgi:alkanesulfonate monooxygenase SsuD/methylene tetrahydromethanopterin reductase-like flavin-dependent oxidoreductase (luciferase family)